MAVYLILVLFVVGAVRISLTLLIRAIVILRHRGCGPWILAAFWGTAFQLLISPIRWVDRNAALVAARVEATMEAEAAGPQHNLYPGAQLASMSQKFMAARSFLSSRAAGGDQVAVEMEEASAKMVPPMNPPSSEGGNPPRYL